MSSVAPTLQAFFTERLAGQLQASPQTIAAYRDSLRLLIVFAHQRTGTTPADLDWADLDATLITAFLDHLESGRGNQPRTRNLRLTAIRSLFTYASLRHPEHAATIQRVLAIPPKRHDQPTLTYLTPEEIDAILAAPDRTNWVGRRDHTLLTVAIQTGLRVSELIGLDCGHATLGATAHIHCTGKGRKQRAVPLTTTTALAVQTWLDERDGQPDQPLFPTRTGRRLSRDAIERRVTKHAATAAEQCPSMASRRITPHTLRHTTAMTLLRAGVDTTVIALWLGHADVRSTNPYLHADLAIKQAALDQTTPPAVTPGRYQPPDTLLEFLQNL